MSDTKHISEIIDSISDQQAELAQIFGGLQAMSKLEAMSKMESAEQSYLRTIRYWMDKVRHLCPEATHQRTENL